MAPEFHRNSKDEIGWLFWGDVLEAADELAGTDVTGIHQPDDAEIANLHLPSAKTTMLAGLISPWIMLGWREWAYSKIAADLPDTADLLQHSDRFCCQHRLQTLAIEVLHHNVWPSLEVARIINDDNVGVAKVGGELGFVVETLQQIALRGRSG